jgi:hypothetical protein
MIETYKILNNIDKVQYEQILPLNQTTTRGHSKKLYKKNCRTNVRKYSFSQRVVDEWNKIPQSTGIKNKNLLSSELMPTLLFTCFRGLEYGLFSPLDPS